MDPSQNRQGRRANDIGNPPSNPADRKVITLRDPPFDTDFLDSSITKVISQNCLKGWPTPALTWAKAPDAFKELAWQDFNKRYTWDAAIDKRVKELYTEKCAARTKGRISDAHRDALKKASTQHPGAGPEHIHLYSPWWCSSEVWAGMCELWSEEKWAKKSKVASSNRSSGAPDGGRAKGTYTGGTRSQLQYMAHQEAHPGATGPMDWKDLFLSLRTNNPDAPRVVGEYERLLAEKYPDEAHRPSVDMELWERAVGVKKSYVQGLGLRRSRPATLLTSSPSGSSSAASTAASSAPNTEQSAEDLVKAICQNKSLLDMLKGHILATSTPEEIAAACASAGQSQASASSRQDNQ